MILTYNVSAQPRIPVPLPLFIRCMSTQDAPIELGFIVLSLVYGTNPFFLHSGDTDFDNSTDILAFSVVVYLVLRSNLNKIPIPRLFRTIAQDATYYFLFIFTSHFVLLMSVRISLYSSIISL